MGNRQIELIPLTSTDSEITELRKMHHTPSIAKYISISDQYFDYVTGSEGVVYYKITADGVLTGGIHCEYNGGILYLSICVMEKYRRQGIAEAALRKLFSALPDEVNMAEVSIDKTNINSQFLFQKLGFTMVGRDDELFTYRLSVQTYPE